MKKSGKAGKDAGATALLPERRPGKAMVLCAETAQEMMTRNPVSIRDGASIKEAAGILTDLEFGAMPVIDDAGRPVGVISRTDIVRFEREKVDYLNRSDETEGVRKGTGRARAGFHVERVDATPVRSIMTPLVFSVAPETPAAVVVKEMLARKVHHLFVVDSGGVLVGVVSAIDVIRRLE